MLRVEDVDLETGKLTIRQSKGHKDRNVMMSAEVSRLCRIYHVKVRLIFPYRNAFFPNRCGEPYSEIMASFWFHLFWKQTGMARFVNGNPPRVHDFWHSFAVKCLNRWIQEGKDLNAYLPYLSLYLGHASLSETDYYLHFVPEFFPVFREKTLQFGSTLIPEVKDENR